MFEHRFLKSFTKRLIRLSLKAVRAYVLAVIRLTTRLKNFSFKKALILSIGIVVLLLLSLFIGVFAAVSVNTTLSTSGSIRTSQGLSLFSNSACTIPLTILNWGSVSPGESSNNTIYIKNANSIPLTLSLATSNWNPISANDPLSLTWDKSGFILEPGQLVVAELSLLVASDVSDISTFEFTIIISGVA